MGIYSKYMASDWQPPVALSMDDLHSEASFLVGLPYLNEIYFMKQKTKYSTRNSYFNTN